MLTARQRVAGDWNVREERRQRALANEREEEEGIGHKAIDAEHVREGGLLSSRTGTGTGENETCEMPIEFQLGQLRRWGGPRTLRQDRIGGNGRRGDETKKGGHTGQADNRRRRTNKHPSISREAHPIASRPSDLPLTGCKGSPRPLLFSAAVRFSCDFERLSDVVAEVECVV